MPSLTISAALLILGKENDLPWLCQTWQSLTGVVGIPWQIPENASPNDSVPNVPGWTVAVAQCVKIYAENLWSKSASDRCTYSMRGFTDSDAMGRKAWNSFVQSGMRKWQFHKTVDQVFADCKLTPYDAMARKKTKTLPTLDQAQVLPTVLHPLASVLFGGDAFEDDASFLVDPIKDFCETVIAQTWHRYRNTLMREDKLISDNESALRAAFEEIKENQSNVSLETLKTYLVLVRKHLTLIQRYKDQATLDEVEEMQKILNAMYAEAQNDDSRKELRQTLPKVFRDALRSLATPQDIEDIEHLINVAIDCISTDDNAGVVELPESKEVDMAWKEGVEDLNSATEDELWRMLGFADKKLPYFQEFTDADGIIDPWSDEGIAWLAKSTSSREPLRPRWHQLVGILRMLERAFDGSPVLLMDGVGIGKTFQVVGFIASLSFYLKHYEKTGRFPGKFAEKKWQGRDGNIPDLPIVISCPVNLHSQWSRELRRFLVPRSVDLLPYLGKLATRRTWWDAVYSRSQQPLHRRVILATESALQDDANVLFIDLIRDVEGTTKKSAAFATQSKTTIFGSEYLVAVMDEAHSARKFNRIHTAYHALRKQSKSIIAMTATPVMTKLQDLWIMGVMMGISAFASKDEYAKMTKELNRAQAKDRKAEKESDVAERLRSVLEGAEVAQVATSSEFVPKLQQWIPFIRESYAKYIIRRTLDSVDCAGNKIFGLPPYHIHVLVLELRGWEKSRLHVIAEELIDHCPVTTLAAAAKNFYIEFRRSLLHPHMNPRGNGEAWKKPLSIEDWKTNYASTKLDVLLEIIVHHLDTDDAPPLSVASDKQSLQPVTREPGRKSAPLECDRIVVFSLFPSSNPAIQDVLKLRGIKALELNGRTPPNKRKTVLEEFRTSTREVGSRVLILSMVGTVGLNLACANIMIIADTLWSALDDEQLRGRIYRYPQPKEVHFYRLVAGGTPDVFLNNIAFDKGVLHQAFLGVDAQSLQLFSGRTNDNEDVVGQRRIESEGTEKMIVDEDEPVTFDNCDTKNARAPGTQGILSPTRPPTKRHAPTSPTSPPLRTRRKTGKQTEGVIGEVKEGADSIPLAISRPSTSLTATPTIAHGPAPAGVVATKQPSASAPTRAGAPTAVSGPVSRVASVARKRQQQQLKLTINMKQDVPSSPPPVAAPPLQVTPVVQEQQDAFTIDMLSPLAPPWDADVDPILKAMREGSLWDLDSKQVDRLAEVAGDLELDYESAAASKLSPRSVEESRSLFGSPVSSTPSSPAQPSPSISAGVKSRPNAQTALSHPSHSRTDPPRPSVSAGTKIRPNSASRQGHSARAFRSSSSNTPASRSRLMETVGGIDLIPGGMGQFRASRTKHVKQKGKNV